MILADFTLALALALLCSVVLYLGLGWRPPLAAVGRPSAILFIFSLLAGFIWAGGAWMPGFGPVFGHFTPLPFVLIAAFLTALLYVVTLPRQQSSRKDDKLAPSLFGPVYLSLVGGLVVFSIIAYIA